MPYERRYGQPEHNGRLEVWACPHTWEEAARDDIDAHDAIGSAAFDLMTDSGPNIEMCETCEQAAADGIALARRYVVVGYRDGDHYMLLETHKEDVAWQPTR